MSRLTYKEVAQAITAKLQVQFPSVPILQEDVEEGSANAPAGYTFLRPSFKVLYETSGSDERQYNAIRTMTCRIYFFPTDIHNYSLEFLDTIDGLESAFALNFACQDRTLTIKSSRNQQIGDATQTKILEFDFDLEWYDDPAQPQPTTTYVMQDIALNLSES